ncbi:unnamed protein product [Tenebrio molitor]|nr:unnamed protein product [Tenebrio molitor]CAH1383422.1 unnamed protein product [Tenebrio molitor]
MNWYSEYRYALDYSLTSKYKKIAAGTTVENEQNLRGIKFYL